MWADAAQDTLYNILHGPPHARKHFEDFLASQFNEESLHFYLDVEKLFQSGLIPEGQNGQISRQRSSFTRRRLSVGSATSRIIATAGDGVATPKPARISNQCTTADATTPHSPAARIATTAGEPDEEVAGESPVPLLNGPQNGQLSASAASAASDGEAEAAASAAAARESAAWAQAQSIYQRFIASSAPSEINLPSKIKEQQFSQQNYQGFLMDAQQEILRLLVLDAFPRFLQSPYCELMLQALGRMQQQQQQQSSAPSAPASAGSAPSALEAQVVETRNNLGDARSPRSWLEAFMHVADVLPASIVVSDMSQPHAPIVYANPAFCTMTGESSSPLADDDHLVLRIGNIWTCTRINHIFQPLEDLHAHQPHFSTFGGRARASSTFLNLSHHLHHLQQFQATRRPRPKDAIASIFREPTQKAKQSSF